MFRNFDDFILLKTNLVLSGIVIFLLMSLFSTGQSDKVDFNSYNAQLLDTLSDEESVIGQSVATSTSSAISYVDEDNAFVSTPNPLPFKPRSADKSSQTSWSNFNAPQEVPVNDPELQAVFPSFAEAYNQEESQLQDDLADLDFVDDSDFAILNIDGSVESFGTTDDLQDVMYYDDDTPDDYDHHRDVPDYYSELEQDYAEPDHNTILSPASGPTTLMLFNIFSPEEVDFLKDLVGEEAIKELKDDVDLPPETVEKDQDEELGPKLEYTTLQSRRPPQYSEAGSKNVYPSSQGPVGPASSIRDSLEVYDRPEYANSDDLVEEGVLVRRPEKETSAEYKADERRQKMEALLQKLSERYEKRVEETTTALSREDALEEEIKETEAETDRMKVMIENLKYRLAQSRPGVNTIDTKDLDDEELIANRNQEQVQSYIRSTAPPVHIDQFSQMIGEKLRDMNTGIHTLDLDEMLDLDHMQIKPQVDNVQAPVPPPGAAVHHPDNDSQKPKKRNVLHPKLKRQRPSIGKAHIPSINLKSYITPAPTDPPNQYGLEINNRPIIPRYVDEQIPTPQPFVYPEYGKPSPKVETKFLPPRTGPRLKGYHKPDPHPMTKELYTYTAEQVPLPPEPSSDRSDHHPFRPNNGEGLPPPPFYADTHKPEDFNPKVGPTHKPPGGEVPPHIDASSMLETEGPEYHGKYVSSNTYRKPIEPIEGSSKSEQLKASRTSKEYAPATFTKYPPPSYDYQQPKLRFDETSITKSPYIQVTPKNIPHHTTVVPPNDHTSASSYSTTPTPSAYPKPEYVNHLETVVSKGLPPRSYAPPPYRPPSYHSAVPEQGPPNGPRPEHVSSLSPPARGYAPPVGHKSTIPPPHKPYHTPRPNYMSSIYPPRKGYVPPSSGNFISTMSPPSHGYSTPLPHVSSIQPPKGDYKPPKFVSTISPPGKPYSTAKPAAGLVSTISPPSVGGRYSTMSPPKKDYHHHLSSHLKSFGKPPSEPYKPPSYMSTMTPPTHGHAHYMHEMKPPSESYEAGMKHHKVKHEYKPPVGDFTALQPNYKETIKPPHASYEKGMKSIMAKLSVPEQQFLEHAMSGSQSYLPPQKEYLAPKTKAAASETGKKISKDYLDTMFKHMHDKLEAPTKGYLPPAKKGTTHYEPPQESYMDPITEYMSSMHLPRKGYLPPDDEEPHTMKPPSAAYEKPMADYLTALKAPESGYLPPAKKGNTMEPPSSAYEKPITDYLAVMHGPEKGYVPPAHKFDHMKPPHSDYKNPATDYLAAMQAPNKNYLPPKPSTGLLPELASYLSPISAYMASMLPPKTEYGPPSKAHHNHGQMKPPSKDYLPPAGYDVKLKPPSDEYLTPFKPHKDPKMIHIQPPSGSYKAPARPPPPPPVYNGVCPPPARNVKCEYVKHQCWSVGTPDVDCPGHGLCCFDGCINSCLPNSPRLPFGPSYHVPPNQAYLVPGQQNLFLLEALASKRRNEEGSDSSTAAQQFIPPMYSLANLDQSLDQNTKSLPQRPYVSQLPKDKPALINLPTDYKPPAKEYLPPHTTIHPIVDGYELPKYEGTSLEDALRPSLQYAPPTLDYQLSHEKANLKAPKGKPGLTLPSKEYLPPAKMTAYQPPDLSYKAPKSLNVYGPPTKEYLPPENIMKYKPPAQDYKVPKEMNQYSPPDKSYVAPKGSLKPPYLPPLGVTSTTLKPDLFSRGALDASFRPPSTKYLAPKSPDHKMPMVPPSEEYQAPPHPIPAQGAHYSPPSKEYIPPSLAVHDPYHQGKALLTPPKEEYLPPTHGEVVEHHLVPEGVPFQVPSKEYLPPKGHLSQKEHALMTPPSEEYLTPVVATDLPPVVVGEHAIFRPPHKEYLPPASVVQPHNHPPIHHHGSKLVPPNKEYLPPASYESTTIHAPPADASYAKFVPPSKEYLAPHENHHLGFKPPSKEYLPPKPIVHPSAPTIVPPPEDPFILSTTPHDYPPIDVTYKPPSQEYLPPHQYSSSTPHSVPHDLHTLAPPSKEYLPPPSNAIEEIGHAIHIAEHHHAHVTVPPALLPKHPDEKYHITATLNQGGVLSPHQATVSKVGPHSINIQIHMPPEEHRPKSTTTERLPPVYYPTTEEAEAEHKILPHMLPHGHHDHDQKVMLPHMLPHGDHVGYKTGPPPSLPQYVPPPDSTHADGYGKLPKYLSLGLPPKKYVPSYHSIPPKEYLPTNPKLYTSILRDNKRPSYESKVPAGTLSDLTNNNNADFLQPLQTLRPPSADFHAPIKEIKAPVKADGYLPPENYTPPSKDYLPPADDETIPAPPNPVELPENIDDGLPSRGPQFPVRQEEVPAKEKDYASPPPRANKVSKTELQLQIEEILNSQVIPPSRSKEKYIPPKTQFDVPKNFVRPDEIVEAVPPVGPIVPLLEEDPDSEVDDFGVIDILDEEELPEPPIPETVPEQLTEQPFLGLAKLIDPERKKSLKELEELKAEVKKLAKLVKQPTDEPPLPPIPTVPTFLGSLQKLQQKLPPQPSSFVPFIEKFDPTVLQQLQSTITNQGNRNGKIPGKPGVDYPDFKTIPATDFSCENFILEGFYADTFTSCQVSFQYNYFFIFTKHK